MTYSDLQGVILSKLNLTPDEAKYNNILDKIPAFCNEALSDIANRGKPLYITYIIDIATDTITVLAENELQFTTPYVTFPSVMMSLTNEFIQRVPIEIIDGVATEVGEYERIDGRNFMRLSNKQLKFPADNNYRYLVRTICRYSRITSSSDELDIDEAILDIIPNFVVAEILRNDDLQTSSQYRNMYEVALSSLDDSVLDPSGTLYDEGW